SIFLTPDGPCCSTANSSETWASRTCWIGGRSARVGDPEAPPNGLSPAAGREPTAALLAGPGPGRTAGSGIRPGEWADAGSPVRAVVAGAGGVTTGGGATAGAGAGTSCGATAVGITAPAETVGIALTEFACCTTAGGDAAMIGLLFATGAKTFRPPA